MKKNVIVAFAALAALSCTGTRPSVVGEGTLALCPETRNCVSSQSEEGDNTHAIAPLKYQATLENAIAKLIAVIDSMPRAVLVAQIDDYLYIEFTSLMWRFVDDVEFVFDDSSKVIHFRSASRLGKNDFGANRKRMEKVRKLFDKMSDQTVAEPTQKSQPAAKPANPEKQEALEQSE